MGLPFYEGLLMLEAMQESEDKPGFLPAGWLDDELRSILEKERAKFPKGKLSSTLYTEKRLLNIAVTGAHFPDGDREWQYRREKLKTHDMSNVAEGEDAGGYWRVKELVDYMPPWEAFLSDKCGFYQEFYQVHWSHPFSVIDYTSVENGSCTGATWEPDECLPSDLDPLRIGAKKKWIKSRRELEAKLEQERVLNKAAA